MEKGIKLRLNQGTIDKYKRSYLICVDKEEDEEDEFSQKDDQQDDEELINRRKDLF